MLLVVAVALLLLGAANDEVTVDVDYLFGTWVGVSLFALAGCAILLVVVVGLLVAGLARLSGMGARRKLERELDEVYARLRQAETRLADLEGPAPTVAVDAPRGAASVSPDDATVALGGEQGAGGAPPDGAGDDRDATE